MIDLHELIAHPGANEIAYLDPQFPHRPLTPSDPGSMRQGGTRFERAHRFIASARAMAERLGVHCNWTIIDVPGVAHQGDKMSAAAAPILAAALHASEVIAA